MKVWAANEGSVHMISQFSSLPNNSVVKVVARNHPLFYAFKAFLDFIPKTGD
jgi:hypothetical protein